MILSGLVSLLIGGCANDTTDASPRQPQVSEPHQTLEGSSWRLVHFQSSKDQIGTVVPPNVDQYTMRFMPGGKLALQLDCNRGMATWKAVPTSATDGSLEITPGAMTRAMCAPGAIDTQVVRDLAFVRSYTFADGRLHLALKADSGFYVWQPDKGGGE
jgi:heat shock protein HslJ